MPTLLKNASNPNPRNVIVNGALDFWQRGTTTTAAGGTPAYLAPDRWSLERSGAGSSTFDRFQDAPNSKLKFCLRATSNDTTSKSFQFWQRLETDNVRPYVATDMTLSFWVKSSEINTATVHVYSNTGATENIWPSTENFSETLVASAATVLVAGVWTRLSLTFTVPINTGLAVGVRSSATTTNGMSFAMTGAMLTQGVSAPANFYRAGTGLQQELAMCQRYYQKSFPYATAPADNAGINGSLSYRVSAAGVAVQHARVWMPVTMRLVAGATGSTVVFYNTGTGTTGKWHNITDGLDSGTASGPNQESETAWGVNNTQVATDGVGDQMGVHWTIDCEL